MRLRINRKKEQRCVWRVEGRADKKREKGSVGGKKVRGVGLMEGSGTLGF